MEQNQQYRVVLGVIGADCHAVGNKILHSFLLENHIQVVNLGVMVSQDEFVQAAIKHQAHAILVSSIYGHGEIDCQGFRDRCEKHGLLDIILYVGGNLVIGKQDFSEVVQRFMDMGFDRVFQSTADLQQMLEGLRSDIDRRRRDLIGHNSAGAAGRQAA
ncbi:methylaspartate mutase subunit S [Sphingomonas histidinilytica]|uniref:methylaspartate mutase subunit S n=1 Tax=Rhizorhabdus histidinilytica TaxID=439228 RepID=UPI001ADCF498|nr:methylaspartate mutase subunit S [Rhizorhabdus histidinilytica]MBO9378872.1 methylaspartate mutase subunit S [Rhizorhabdus histidinilytica]